MDEFEMMLQTILFGQFTPPPVGKVRRHSILQEGGKPLAQYKYKPARPCEKSESAEKMYELIKANPGICIKEVRDHLGKVISYVYRIRDILISQNRIYGVRGTSLKHGGPKITLFYAKD